MKPQSTILYRSPREDAKEDFARCTIHRVREIRDTIAFSEEANYDPWTHGGFLVDIPEPVEGNPADWRLNTYRIESKEEWEKDFLKDKFEPIAKNLNVFVPMMG